MGSVTTTCRDITALNTKAQVACKLFLLKCVEQGVHVFLTETYRPQERQDYLYTQGRTRPGNKVTWTRTSRHTGRMAWDIACRGANLYDTGMLEKAGRIAKELGITWGGNWYPPDKPHFEITKNWVESKKEEEMVEKRYNILAEVPEWGKAAIKKLIDNGGFADKNRLNLSDDMIRVFVILDR